jgi:CubicO group peptidase (beta-lactamase class C family)
VLEKVSGLSFEQYLAANFFQPLGMTQTTVVTAAAQLPSARAHGFKADSSGFRLNDYEPSSTKGAGGIYSSLADLYRWGMAIRAGSLLSDSLRTIAATAAVRTNGRLTPWGMGWLAESHGTKDPLNGRHYVAATGNLRGFSGLLKYYREDDLLIVWIANANSPQVFDALHPIAAEILLGK